MAALAYRCFFLLLAVCAITHAAPARALDQIRIHAYYHDGEFDKVIRELEAFQKSGRACSHAESLFVEKHLAVVYAANPGTRELGRYHMFRILDLAPTSDLLDMFVGEEVGGVFEKVGKEYALRNAAKPAVSRPFPNAASAPASAASSAGRQSAHAQPANARPASTANSTTAVKRPQTRTAAASASVPAGIATPRSSPKPHPDSSASTREAGFSGPAWKEPGLWIGGGAALAVVAFTLFYSGSESPAPQGKTYVVPATASR